MNHKSNQPNSSEQGKSQRPSLQTGVEKSDSKEILFLAAGLITLTLGLGGLFMYSADEPLPLTASQEAAEEVSAFQMTKDFATSNTSNSSSPLTTEPALHLVSNSPEGQEAEEADVYFEFNRWALSDEAKDLIKTNVEAQGGEWTGTLHIDGHTDAQGPDTYNRALGLKRAESVKTYLVSLGISEDRIEVQSLGKDGAVCVEETPTCFEDNRRAHVAFLSDPAVQQDDTLLSMTPDALGNSIPEESAPGLEHQPAEDSSDEMLVQEEIPGELVAVDPSAESLP